MGASPRWYDQGVAVPTIGGGSNGGLLTGARPLVTSARRSAARRRLVDATRPPTTPISAMMGHIEPSLDGAPSDRARRAAALMPRTMTVPSRIRRTHRHGTDDQRLSWISHAQTEP